GPASATGGWLTFCTLTVTVSVAVATPSLTVSVKTSAAPTGPTNGAMKIGFAVSGPASVTTGPDVCCQLSVSASPSGSKLATPVSVTEPPSLTVWSAPASATGGLLTFRTRTSTLLAALASVPSSTRSWNVSVAPPVGT